MGTQLQRALLAVGAGLALPQAAYAQKDRVEISPYIAVDQTVVANLAGGSEDVLTYTTVSAGVSASIATRRAEVTVNAEYGYQKSWQKGERDQHTLSGIAAARLGLIRNDLSIEGAALGTRVNSGGLTGANGLLLGDRGTSLYSGYVGPTLTTHVGGLGVNAAYRFGYTRLSDDTSVTIPGVTASPDRFTSSQTHYASGSIGMKTGETLPFGWTLGAGWQREDSKLLDNRFDDKWGRGDITLPVTSTVALIGGVGYERIRITQRDVVRDAGGSPVIGGDGRYVTDTSAPRQLAYDQDGLIWDAGVLWRPSPRTSVTASVGRRYGSTSYTGSISWQPTRDTAFNLAVYDQINGFGGLLNDNLAQLPASFTASRNPFTGELGGCIQGPQGGGICLNSALAGIGSGHFRNRGVAAQLTSADGPWSYGLAGGYAQRKFIASPGSVLASASGRVDENYYTNAFIARKLDAASSLTANLYGNYYDAAVPGSVDVLNAGGYIVYSRNLSRRLSATAAAGVDGVDPKGFDKTVSALGQLGLQYGF